MLPQTVVSREQWLTARKEFLAKEKAFTRARDQLSAERHALPWVKLDKTYLFDTPAGKKSLADLFDGRSQLIVYHFMLGPDWIEGCPSCSYLADHFDGMLPHLAQRDVTFTAISRAPLAEIEAYKRRMGWHFPWASSFGNDFNFDFGVSFELEGDGHGRGIYNFEEQDITSDEMPGLSTFYQDGAGDVFHTYSAYARGLDILVGTYNFLDHAPNGRDEDKLPWTMAWVRRHDEYEDAKQKSCCGGH
jgi:predicted dithiol-disulfide oxidoreductase (DUF899 family)